MGEGSWWRGHSQEGERMGVRTEEHWQRVEVGSWGSADRGLKRPGRMGRDGMRVKGSERWGMGRQGASQGKMGFQGTGGFQEKMER